MPASFYTFPEIFRLECRLWDYFTNFSLPNQVTIYDLLIISLKRKDCIATFNWDSLLIEAYFRVEAKLFDWGIKNPVEYLPHIHHLHGNVGVGLCYEHKKYGKLSQTCPVCYKPLEKSQLLYPVKKKNYSCNAWIINEWNVIRRNLEFTPYITIFGYGAPSTDKDAVELFLQAKSNRDYGFFEQFEAIDIKGHRELHDTWNNFIQYNHYDFYTSFYESSLANHSRRTLEHYVYGVIKGSWEFGPNPLPRNMSWDDFERIFKPLILNE